MKILLVAQTFTPQKEGGAELVARRAAEFLSQEHDLRVLSLRPKSDHFEHGCHGPEYVDRLPYLGSYLPTVEKNPMGPLTRMSWHLANAYGGVSEVDLRDYLTNLAPDLIYAHNATAFLPQLGRLAHRYAIPVVLHVHDYSLACPKTSMFRKGNNCTRQCVDCRLLTQQWQRAVNRSVTDVIAVSRFVRDRLQDLGVLPNARWHVVHNVEDTVSLDAFRAQRNSQYGFTFGYLGALTPNKGISLLIDAFLKLPKKGARLVIGGTGRNDYVNILKEKTKHHQVDWLGHVDPNAVYAQADVMIIPSLWHEPQALVVTEALSRGMAVIASDRGGNTEVLKKYARSALFDPDNPEMLASAMDSAMRNRGSARAVGTDLQKAPSTPSAYFDRIQRILDTAAISQD
tara:strand:+ start:5622 stop:6821 length:1200 start_codon:yes stop_codon:yes gene_type:complete